MLQTVNTLIMALRLVRKENRDKMSKKRYDNLFDDVVDINNLESAYRKSMKGRNKYSTDAMKFASNETYNLLKLRESLIDGTYEFSGYKRFKVYEPKERIIDAPYHRDKVVQLAIDAVLKRIYQPSFIYDTYACLDNKGAHKAVERVSQFLSKANWEFGDEAYIIKLDISKFFYSIDRDILKIILRNKLKCKRTLELIDIVIDSAEQIDPLGVPLGNTLSQIFTNIYMNKFDQYCKRILQIKYYVRYADDVIAIVKNKSEAQLLLESMEYFLNNVLKLAVHPFKTQIFPLEQGVNAYGFKIYKTHRLLRNDSKKKIKRKAKKMPNLIRKERLTKEVGELILNSWHGHAMYGSSRNFIESLKRRNNFIYQDARGKLNIDESIIREDVN